MPGSGFEPLYTAAEMRLAEEAYPGFPATASRVDGEGGDGRRPRGDEEVPERTALRGRLRGRLERR